MKGITPVVAVILLLLVTIAVVGFAFGFFQRILGVAAAAGENQTQETIIRGAKTVSIDNINPAGPSATVRNTGTQTIIATDINIFVGPSLVTCVWSPVMPLAPRASSTCTWTGSCTGGTQVRIVAPGNEATIRC